MDLATERRFVSSLKTRKFLGTEIKTIDVRKNEKIIPFQWVWMKERMFIFRSIAKWTREYSQVIVKRKIM